MSSFRFTADIEAVSTSELAYRLRDIATDILNGQQSPESVFASPSSKGVVTLSDLWEGIADDH